MLVDPTGKWAIVGNYGNSAGSEGTSIAVFAIGADGKLADAPKALVPQVPKPKRLEPAAPPLRTAIRRPRTGIPCCFLRTAGSCSSRRRASTRSDVPLRRGDGRADAEHRRRPSRRRSLAPRLVISPWKDRKVPLRLLRGRACCRDLCLSAANGTLSHSQSVDLPPEAPQTGSCARSRCTRTATICTSRTAAITAWRSSRSTRRRGHSPSGTRFRSAARRGTQNRPDW